MKGLLLKDIFVLVKRLRYFLILILVFSFAGNSTQRSIPIGFAGLLPLTALAYDERSKWNVLAAMMPYSRKAIVGEKYLLGYLLILLTAVIQVAFLVGENLIKKAHLDLPELIMLAVTMVLTTVILSLILPLSFRFGTEKGRIGLILFYLVFLGAGAMLVNSQAGVRISFPSDPTVLILGLIVTVILINILSFWISLKIYQKESY